ncbi:MAG: C40 family peptidase [Chitinophagales bacterium]
MLLLFSSCSTQKKTTVSRSPASANKKESSALSNVTSPERTTENSSSLRSYQEKYRPLLGSPASLTNPALFQFMNEWLKVPYKYGGNSKAGVDCSRLSIFMMQDVYHKTISGSSADIFRQTRPVSNEGLQEGDLVFFKINSTTVSHMGVYLVNNKFIHSTTQAGVIISDLNDVYYRKYFFSAGRVK